MAEKHEKDTLRAALAEIRNEVSGGIQRMIPDPEQLVNPDDYGEFMRGFEDDPAIRLLGKVVEMAEDALEAEDVADQSLPMIDGGNITARYVQDLRALCNRLESQNKRLRNDIKGIIFMAADGVGEHYLQPVKLFENIRDEARAALRRANET